MYSNMIQKVVKNLQPEKENNQEQSWDNPKAPEEAHDEREVEQLLRQKEEAERRYDNLTKDDDHKKDN